MKINPKYVSPVFMWLVVIAGIAVSYFAFSNHQIFAVGPWSYFALGLAVANWIYLSVLAYSVHRQAPRSAGEVEEVVMAGIYSYLRHPMYAADIVLGAGILLVYPRVWVLISFFWLVVVLVFWASLEERALEDRFAQDYRAYRSRVPMIIPNFRRM